MKLKAKFKYREKRTVTKLAIIIAGTTNKIKSIIDFLKNDNEKTKYLSDAKEFRRFLVVINDDVAKVNGELNEIAILLNKIRFDKSLEDWEKRFIKKQILKSAKTYVQYTNFLNRVTAIKKALNANLGTIEKNTLGNMRLIKNELRDISIEIKRIYSSFSPQINLSKRTVNKCKTGYSLTASIAKSNRFFNARIKKEMS